MERVFSKVVERAFRGSAKERPFTDRFETVEQVVAGLERRGLLDDESREYAKRAYVLTRSCEVCGGSGFSGYGSGYDAVCGVRCAVCGVRCAVSVAGFPFREVATEGDTMNREEAIGAAQSALRLRCGVVQLNTGAWRWRKYGWDIVLAESGEPIKVIDEWKAFRLVD